VQFNTYLFGCFFAVVLAVHHAPLPWTARKVCLLVFSYVFYAAWDPPFVILLWASTVVDWFVAKAMAASDQPRRRKALLGISLTFNLALLGYFKYAGFLARTWAELASAIGLSWTPGELGVALPIGISFYTFMTISYTIDVYLRRAAPARSFLDYALYVTFFPHLVSGPIVRATELVPQFEAPRRANGAQFGWGLALTALGLFEKVVVADGLLAPVVDKVYAAAQVSTGDATIPADSRGDVREVARIACEAGQAEDGRFRRRRERGEVAVEQLQAVSGPEESLGCSVGGGHLAFSQSAYCLRNSRLRILPFGLRGRSATYTVPARRCCLPTRWLVHSTNTPASGASQPAAATTSASGVSPQRSLGTPTTATSATAG